MSQSWRWRTFVIAIIVLLFTWPVLATQQSEEAETCSLCHLDLPLEPLQASVHQGLPCMSCHPGAKVVPHERTMNPEACAACHPGARAYWESIHGRAYLQGVPDVPDCAACHGGHHILSTKDPDSPVSSLKLPQTCGRCHENAGISERFGLPSHRYTTYIDSFHGISLRYGNLVAANCTSCHGNHLILAASDKDSSIHPQNLPKTCGQCHPNAGENFTKGKIHVEARPGVSYGVWAVRLFYTGFIGLLGFFFLTHIVLDAIKWLRRRHVY
ncbi:MAG: hypothetical protein A2Z21_07930 [Candidatus Fraserbacteria bacterium RBG_16_55_9]|uniref:Tetrahaem cytochrome domain-containing protein n=1 Tax=Fraserbacteria sp. (strain RBG_16_55_9) TaxID=1817864 RepID=A0A1F5UQD5_FRAXR|nr:MAG: hypothetical protein A2Z21_07930 [Candidatus Fraserbacteria bacterium RBG_16_55_9]